MLLTKSVWALFFLSLVVFIILIMSASAYSVTNCNNGNTCEDGFSETPSYRTRKNILQWANGFSWAIIISFVLGLALSYTLQ
jgi:hypothetical protein